MKFYLCFFQYLHKFGVDISITFCFFTSLGAMRAWQQWKEVAFKSLSLVHTCLRKQGLRKILQVTQVKTILV